VNELLESWRAAWPAALAHWSKFVQLHEPAWCITAEEEKREQLSGSFAMIRLLDHAVVISLKQVQESHLERFAVEVLAHEIGHHVYCPADLTDNARLLVRIRAGLPTKETFAPMISNLYSDLLINDRLQRSVGLDMAGVYKQLAMPSESKLWSLYLRIYESLWKLPAGDLAHGPTDERLEQDARLGARLIRSYARDWLHGSGRFAALCLPYLIEDDEKGLLRVFAFFADTRCAGAGGFPDGLAEIDDDELFPIHPSEDPELTGLEIEAGTGRVPGELSGRKTAKNYRQPFEYAEVLKAAGVDLDEREIVARYYRELALPHLIPFPSQHLPQATDPLPEGLEMWDVDTPIERVDWFGTLLSGQAVIPGVTTKQRQYGDSPASDPDDRPFDLYLGIDCSGSMGDPATRLSHPILAGAIMALSALRAGSRVKVVLSGEPGQSISTDGFVRTPAIVLRTLVSYLGTGYSFGIHRLAETYPTPDAAKRPSHILIVSDNDMFSMLDSESSKRKGWDVAAEAVKECKGGATYVLQLPGYVMNGTWPQPVQQNIDRMKNDGWNVGLVNDWEELVAFAREFSRRNFDKGAKHAR